MDFHTTTSTDIAEVIDKNIGRNVNYRKVETDGAAQAAAQISDLL